MDNILLTTSWLHRSPGLSGRIESVQYYFYVTGVLEYGMMVTYLT
jgi:hypothetical protein